MRFPSIDVFWSFSVVQKCGLSGVKQGLGKRVSSKEPLPLVFNINKSLKGFRHKFCRLFLQNIIFIRDGILFQIFAP